MGIKSEVGSLPLRPRLRRITLGFFALVVRALTCSSPEQVHFHMLFSMVKVLLGVNQTL